MSAFAAISLVLGTLFAAGSALALRAYSSSRHAVRVRATIVGKVVKRMHPERRSGTIPVLHPAGDPERARIDSRWTRDMVPACLRAPGVLWARLLVYVAFAY